MRFSDQLKRERHRLGLTQTEAAGRLEVAVRTWQHWEEGTRVPLKVAQEGTLARLHKFAQSAKRKPLTDNKVP
jgi:transcriptional regulator with XRE-family HTH domain